MVGWTCPKCQNTHGPWVDTCFCAGYHITTSTQGSVHNPSNLGGIEFTPNSKIRISDAQLKNLADSPTYGDVTRLERDMAEELIYCRLKHPAIRKLSKNKFKEAIDWLESRKSTSTRWEELAEHLALTWGLEIEWE